MVEDGTQYSKWIRSLALALPLILVLNSCQSPDPTDWRTPMESPFAKTPIEELHERAELNDFFAMVHLGWRYDTGTGVPVGRHTVGLTRHPVVVSIKWRMISPFPVSPSTPGLGWG